MLVWLSVWNEGQIVRLQLMSLPIQNPIFSCLIQIQTGFTLLVPACLGSPEKRAIKLVYCGCSSNAETGRQPEILKVCCVWLIQQTVV